MFTLNEAHVTIVGLGLMGGSMALALRPHVAHLTAIDLDPETRAEALARRIVDDAVSDLATGVAQADVVVLATPVGTILQILRTLPELQPNGCIVLDLGSTKGAICEAMNQLPSRFAAIGGHPMCGKEVSGLAAADATLYHDQTFILCRTERTDQKAEAAALALVTKLGANPLFLTADEHDRMVGLVSHLPYFVASLLMKQVAAEASHNRDMWQVTASGFRDTTRLAGSDPHMLEDIVRTNRLTVLAWLQSYRDNLDALLTQLEKMDEQWLFEWLAERQKEYRTYREKK